MKTFAATRAVMSMIPLVWISTTWPSSVLGASVLATHGTGLREMAMDQVVAKTYVAIPLNSARPCFPSGIGGEPVITEDDSRFQGRLKAWDGLNGSARDFLKGRHYPDAAPI